MSEFIEVIIPFKMKAPERFDKQRISVLPMYNFFLKASSELNFLLRNRQLAEVATSFLTNLCYEIMLTYFFE